MSNTRMTPREKRRLGILAVDAGISESDWIRMTINRMFNKRVRALKRAQDEEGV